MMGTRKGGWQLQGQGPIARQVPE